MKLWKDVQNANGATNVQQSMVVDSRGTTISGDFFAENTDAFMKEIAEAIRLVASSELDEVQKKEVQREGFIKKLFGRIGVCKRFGIK